MHVGSQMHTFIKILCKIIFHYENGVFWYFEVVFVLKIDQWRTQEFFFRGGGGVQQIQLRTEDRTGIWGW
jgi:hypothetical protein